MVGDSDVPLPESTSLKRSCGSVDQFLPPLSAQDEWCQFNCNSALPNCPADTCKCEGSIAMSRIPSHNDDSPPGQHAQQLAP